MVADIAAEGEVEILAVEAIIAVPSAFVHVVHGGVVGIKPLVSAQIFQVGAHLQIESGETVLDFLLGAVCLLRLGEKWKKNQ